MQTAQRQRRCGPRQRIRLPWCIFFAMAARTLAAENEPSWIWGNGSPAARETVFFRKEFRTPAYLWNSRLTLSADDEAEVFLNGVAVAKCQGWDRPVRMETTARLNQGPNVIAVRARNNSGPAGLLVHLRLGGEATVVSDGSWLATTNEEPNWFALAFNAAHWQPARVLGPLGMEPWGDVLHRAAAAPPDALRVAAGFGVELLRSAEPGEGSWINLAFDDHGRLLISSEGENTPLLRMTLKGDRVERVEPACKWLRFAMGLLWADGGLYANALGPQGSGLYRAVDRDGDGQFGPEELRLLVATRGGGEHGYHAVRLGPDGKLYVLNGNGTQLPSAISERSPYRNYQRDVLALGMGSNESGPEGYVLRGTPDGGDWELFLGGLRNAYDFDFNSDGELFIFDSDMEWDWGTPWYRPTRLLHGVSGAEFGWRPDRDPWPEHYQDSLDSVLQVGLGSPTGVEFGTHSRFPEKYRRALFALDWSYGRILAIHLRPEGASYRGSFEEFVRGTPLNLTDLAFGPDGALYFVTGGRGTQSGLYRVRYLEEAEPARPKLLETNAAAAAARALRHTLEQFHVPGHPEAIDIAWPHLGSEDRFIRYAARLALEAQDVNLWRDRARTEPKPAAGLTALLALARVGGPAIQSELLNAAGRFAIGSLDESQRLLKCRVLELSFLRQGRPTTVLADPIRNELSRVYPTESWPQNRELIRLLTWLEAPDAVAKTMHLLETAPTQEEQVHYIEQLRLVRLGWTPALRRRYFTWWIRPRAAAAHPPEVLRWFAEVDRAYVDGAWMDKFLENFRAEAIEQFSEEERRDLAALIQAPFRPAVMVPSNNRTFVRSWTVEDLLPLLSREYAPRDFERGRQAFVDAQCMFCHRFGNAGGSVGPELTAVGTRYDRRSLLESILEPSKAINEQYQNTVVTLRDGEQLTGRLISENSEEVVVETNPYGGGREQVPRSQVETIQKAALSPMPVGLVDILSRDEILDLIAYLESGGRAEAALFKATHQQ